MLVEDPWAILSTIEVLGSSGGFLWAILSSIRFLVLVRIPGPTQAP